MTKPIEMNRATREKSENRRREGQSMKRGDTEIERRKVKGKEGECEK